MKYGLQLVVAWLAAGAMMLSCAARKHPVSHAGPTGHVVASGNMAGADAAAVSLPSEWDVRPAEYAGLHNVVAYADGLYSGSAPEGKAGFDTLAALGIRTIISVDGAQPDLAEARAHGLRYVHLPIGYNGMDEARTLEIARAARDLPGPVYIHCHHGKHRSAGAAGAAAVTLGRLTNEQARDRMVVSGTAPHYTGLYKCVAVARLASDRDLASAAHGFPESWKTTGLVQSMVQIEHATDHLKAIEHAGWNAPPDHPDLVPVAEAGLLSDLFRNLQDDERCRRMPREFRDQLARVSEEARQLESALTRDPLPLADLSGHWVRIAASCTDCHAKYRD